MFIEHCNQRCLAPEQFGACLEIGRLFRKQTLCTSNASIQIGERMLFQWRLLFNKASSNAPSTICAGMAMTCNVSAEAIDPGK